jgi:hypothetical protein
MDVAPAASSTGGKARESVGIGISVRRKSISPANALANAIGSTPANCGRKAGNTDAGEIRQPADQSGQQTGRFHLCRIVKM